MLHSESCFAGCELRIKRALYPETKLGRVHNGLGSATRAYKYGTISLRPGLPSGRFKSTFFPLFNIHTLN